MTMMFDVFSSRRTRPSARWGHSSMPVSWLIVCCKLSRSFDGVFGFCCAVDVLRALVLRCAEVGRGLMHESRLSA